MGAARREGSMTGAGGRLEELSDDERVAAWVELEEG